MNDPQIYVGTYGKYNNGSINGAWLKLTDFEDKDAFYKACRKLHADEHDPEFMFQDYENFPECFYSESGSPDALWEWLEHDEADRELISIYLENIDHTTDFQAIKDTFLGCYANWDEFVSQYLENSAILRGIPDEVADYFDYEAYGRNLRHDLSVAELAGDGDLTYVWSN